MSGIYPGSTDALGNVERLASAGEWTALAVLASLGNRPDAMGALAAAADKEPAFRWMWAFVNSGVGQPQYWQQVSANLASGIKVPENLKNAVRQFVLTPAPQQSPTHQSYQQYAGGPNLRQQAQVRLLSSLDTRTDFARELAQTIIEAEEGRYWPELRHAAFDVVGARRQKADRLYVLERAEDLPPRERLRPLLGLSAPYSKVEQDVILAALKESLPVGSQFPVGAPGPNEYWTWARELSVRLSPDRLEDLLRESWAQSVTDRGNLFGGDFIARLGLEKLEKLLASDLDEAIRRDLISVASTTLPLEGQADLGRWTHENLDPDWSQPLRDQLSTYARVPHYGSRSPQGEGALEALRDFALACDDAKTAADFVACLAPGEAVELLRTAMASNPLPRRVGRIAAELLRRDPAAFEQEVAAIISLYPEDKGRATFLTGFVEDQPETEEPLDLGFLGPQVLAQPASIAVLAEAGYGRSVVSAALQSDDRARSCLLVVEAAIEHLDEAVLEDVMEECGWFSLDPTLYRRYVAALRRRPYALFRETGAALKSLSGPEASVISNDKLEVLLRAALETDADGLTKWVGDRRHQYLEALFATTSKTVHGLARDWAARMPPDEALVDLIVRTDDSTVGSEEEFAIVRRALADVLVAKALDPTTDYGARGDSLELAQRADPSAAREAAIAQRATWPVTFRRRAARVLATTDPRPGDEEALNRLLEGEGDAQARQDLLNAKRNLTSGSVEQAVRNLRDLAALDPQGGPGANVLLPYHEWHDAFVANTDKARARVGGEPSGYIDALITLAELMVEQAVIARFDADPSHAPVKVKEGEALRHNHPTKPKVGALLERQQLQRVFPWFPEVMVLRKLRGVHATPSGTTKPLSLTQKHVIEAEGLFSRIIEGWQRSMLESYRGESGDQG